MVLPLDDGYDYSEHVYQGGGRTVHTFRETADKIAQGLIVDMDVDLKEID